MKWITEKTSVVITAWDSFWFKSVDTLSLSCFRFCFCSVLLGMYLIRFFDIRVFFYESGLITGFGAKALNKMYTDKAFYFVLSSDILLWFCYLVFIIILLLMALGAANRFLAAIAFVLHLVFLHRNPSIVFGADIVATFWAVLFDIRECQQSIKMDALFFKQTKGSGV